MSIQDTNQLTHNNKAGQAVHKSLSAVAFSLLMLVCFLMNVPVATASQEDSNVSVFMKEIDGKIYIYATQSHAVRQMPTMSQWMNYLKDKPTKLQVIDGKSIVACVCCGILMDVSNDLDWRFVRQHQITVGARCKRYEKEQTGDDEFTLSAKPMMLYRKGFGCDSCWKEYLHQEDEANAENKRRKELNAGRARMKFLLDKLYEEEHQAPIIDVAPTCDKHPSMKGFCACLNASRTRPKPVQRPVHVAAGEDDETKQMPMLVPHIDIAAAVKQMEVTIKADKPDWRQWAEDRHRQEQA